MDIGEIKEIKKRQRLFNSYSDLISGGRASKKFKPTNFDLVEEYWENNKKIDDVRHDLKDIEEKNFEGELEPFNLDDERDEGIIGKSGDLRIGKKGKGKYDPWLDTIDKPVSLFRKEIVQEDDIDVDMMKKKLKGFLNDHENVSQAMRRLKGNTCVRKSFKKNVRKNAVKEQGKNNNEENSEKFKELCEICSKLIIAGCDELYEWTKDDL